MSKDRRELQATMESKAYKQIEGRRAITVYQVVQDLKGLKDLRASWVKLGSLA